MTGKSSSPRKAGDARKRVARCVKRLRIERDLSQEQLAELAGFHRTYVSQLERCVANISIDGLDRLAASLSVDVTELLAKPMWSANEAESVTFGLRLPMP